MDQQVGHSICFQPSHTGEAPIVFAALEIPGLRRRRPSTKPSVKRLWIGSSNNRFKVSQLVSNTVSSRSKVMVQEQTLKTAGIEKIKKVLKGQG
ncbi:hypothetical protein AVEN_241622-1 [Araneus ventricosus]|uniref:Uncharacterized protein n=1 Tax=Araneus ventricosus TaxID=182803 RepID=A0A4Y2SUE8_ARAVE|nr:hypothetical protein AVEN_241622-1 [Araneus ventricosus]